MSLKTRLQLSIVALVISVVAALSALNLHSVASARFEDVLDRANQAALQVQSVLAQRLRDESVGKPAPRNLEATIGLWNEIVEEDEEIPRMLKDTLASSRTIVAIHVASGDGRILASSNPASVGERLRKLPSLAAWSARSPWEKLTEVLSERLDYEVTLPLGVSESETPVFQIRVLVSSVLLKNTLMPQVHYMGIALSVAFLVSILLAVVASRLAIRPLAIISAAIDRIASDEPGKDPLPEPSESKEFAAVQSKLSLLGQQYRGVREDAVQLRGNIERLLERLEEAALLFDRNDRLAMAGRSAEILLGRARWELMGRTLHELFPPTTELGAAVESAVRFRNSVKDRAVALERDGQLPARLLVNVELLEDFPKRERLGTLVTLRDAETRRQLQSQLDVSTRLAAISRLTGGVAHEIKNPLNAIALHLEVLKSRLRRDEPELGKEVEVIASEITRLDRVVKTFLDFTRPMDLRPEDVDVPQLAREVTALVQPGASKQNVEIELDCPAEAVIVQGDRDLLKQALLNVIVNGVEAMKHGGKLQVQVRQSGAECLVNISDQGVGILPEIRERIFQLYFTTKGKGSGIGLAMTFRIVQLHNGTIDFTSEPGNGTTFRLRLPAVPRDTPAPADPRPGLTPPMSEQPRDSI